MHPRKVCYKCEKSLPATTDFFNANAAKADGLHIKCKSCTHYENALRWKHKKSSRPDPNITVFKYGKCQNVHRM